MRVFVLHLFADGVLSETRVFAHQGKAREARIKTLGEVGAGVVDGEVVDVNGSTWSASIEAVDLEEGESWL